MAWLIDPQHIERAEKALRRAGFIVDKTETNAKTGAVIFKAKVADE